MSRGYATLVPRESAKCAPSAPALADGSKLPAKSAAQIARRSTMAQQCERKAPVAPSARPALFQRCVMDMSAP
jgi:hypothetical protein